MDRDEVIGVLAEILLEFQENVDDEVPEIDEHTRPIGDLEEFDSLTGVQVTGQCVKRFGLADSDDVQSLFVGEDDRGRPCALTVGQAADLVIELAPGA